MTQVYPQKNLKSGFRAERDQIDRALRSLITLAQQHLKGPISAHELAEIIRLPEDEISQVLRRLEAEGIVRFLGGRLRAYELALPPERITLGRIVRIFSVSESHDVDRPGGRASFDIREYSALRIEESTLAALATIPVIPRHQVFDQTFEDGAGI